MRRSAYTGTTPKRSGRAAKATSSPSPASASCCAASDPSSASSHPANWSSRATVARPASLRASLRMPFRITLMRRPAAYASSRANCLSRPPHTITRLPRWSRIARARSASALMFVAAPTSTGSPPWVATSAGVPLVVASTMVLPATAAAVISRGELPRANPSIFTLRRSPARTTPSFSRLEALGFALEELRVHLACDEVGMAHDSTEERDGRGHAFNDKRVECLPHARERLLAAVAVHDQLREQRVVVRRDRVAGVDVGIDP